MEKEKTGLNVLLLSHLSILELPLTCTWNVVRRLRQVDFKEEAAVAP